MPENNQIDFKELNETTEHCGKFSSKCIEICSIILYSFLFVLVMSSLIIIKWKYLSGFDLFVFILMLLITIVNLILSIIIRYWRAKSLIKTDKKSKGNSISKACIALSLVLVILCFIEYISFNNSIDSAKLPCEYKNYQTIYYNNLCNLYQKKIKLKLIRENIRRLEPCPPGQTYIQPLRFIDIFLGLFCIYFMQALSYSGFAIWLILKQRIDNKLDGPEKEKIFIKQNIETLSFLREVGEGDKSNIIIYNNENNIEQNNDIMKEIKPEIVDTQRNLK